MKSMVCIIGGQHIPNLLGIYTEKPERIFMLVTEGMKNKEVFLRKAILLRESDYKPDIKTIKIGDENSIDIVCNELENIYKDYPVDDWVINLTGGTKPMSIAAYKFSEKHGLRTFYIAAGNQQIAIDLLGKTRIKLEHRVSTEEFLAGYGYDLINRSKLEESEAKNLKLVDLAAKLTKHHKDESLQNLLEKLQEMKNDKNNLWKRKKKLILTEGSELHLEDDFLRKEMANKFNLKAEGTNLTGELDKHATEFLTGKWLEVFVWALLSKYMKETDKIWDLHLGMGVGEKDDGKNNDLDVSFIYDQKLCIVECKTGKQDHTPDTNPPLYKLEAIKSGITALRADTFFASTSTNILINGTSEVKESIQNRCEIYKCQIIAGNMLKEMAEMFLNKDPALNKKIEEVFIQKYKGKTEGKI